MAAQFVPLMSAGLKPCGSTAFNGFPPHIPKPIPSPTQPNRIGLDVPATGLIVVAVDVERQARLLVPLLAGVAQVEGHFWPVAGQAARCCAFGLHITLGCGGGAHLAKPGQQPLPCDLALGVGQAPGGAQVVGV